jgi:hypothetical protein
MRDALRSRGEAFVEEAQSEVANYLETFRSLLAERLDSIDTKDVRKRADRVSEAVTEALIDSLETVRNRVRPQPRRRVPIALVALGGIAVGAGVAAVFLGRRQDVRERFTELTGQAQRQLPQVLGKSSGNGRNGHSLSQEESQLRTAVEQAIFSGEQPSGELRVDVEGRTVYLRGHLEDRGFVDTAVQKAQSVEGVAAVINLVTA